MESGAFTTPNYPDPYPANVECVWTVRSSPGNRLQLSFLSVSLSVDASDLEDFIRCLGQQMYHVTSRLLKVALCV